MRAFINKIKDMSNRQHAFYVFITFCFIISIVFIYHNHSFYDKPIAKVTETSLLETTKTTDEHHNEDQLFTQHITAQLKNGEKKGKPIFLTNEYSSSGAYDHKFTVGKEVFVSIDKNTDKEGNLTGKITNVKRDKYIVIVAWIFIFTLLIIGKRQGQFTIISFIINILLLSYALDIYVNYTSTNSLLWISALLAILFTFTSLLFINGFNEKTYAAIVTTLLGTFFSLFIAHLAMWLTSENGLHYEEMQFLTRPYYLVFMAGLFIGSLGAVMDVAITMSSSIFELYERNHGISMKSLKKSGMDIGRDIMGTITNILFFAYLSGSIPMLILYLKNSSSLGYTLSMNLSLEIARALAGGIGVVLTIPISLYISIFFVNRKREKS